MREYRITQVFINLLIILNIFAYIPYVSAQEYCYSSGGVFGIIVLSVFTTIFVIALAVTLLWLLWTKNLLNLDFILKKINKSKAQTQEKRIDLETGKQDYAFDNPYFEDEENDSKNHKDVQTLNDTIIFVQGSEEQRQQNFVEINNKNNSENNSEDRLRNGQIINNRFVKSLPLSAVFSNVPFKKSRPENVKSMDDYFYQEKHQRLEAELIGRDFTGLGFNISGNMKDGIFVKNVLNRGPANESGKIKSGDRIVGVKVSFEGMVFDDAVSILSYASPYNVTIEVEKCGQYSTIDRLTTNLNSNKNLNPSTDKSLVHPLYRSHSVDDLTRISKDVSLSEKSSSSGANVIQKIKTEILNRIHLKAPTVEEKHSNKHNIEVEKQIDIEIEPAHKEVVATELHITDTSITETKVIEDVVEISETDLGSKTEDKPTEEPTVKKVVPAKRKGKAPQPPAEPISPTVPIESVPSRMSPTNGETIETRAQVHNEELNVLKAEESIDEKSEVAKELEQMVCHKQNGHLTSSDQSIDSEEQTKSEELNSMPIRANSPQRVQSPNGKTKSSSMSDLTQHNRTDKLQTTLLERAVSLDMNEQNLPEENLSHLHGRNLILNEEEIDSMPIMNWSSNKQTNNEINSSESTLNEINQSFVNSIDLSEKIDSSEVKLFDLSDDLIIGSNLSDPEDYVSHIEIEVPPIASTPLKTNENSANKPIDQYIHLDSSFSSSEADSENQTIKETNESRSESEAKQTDDSNKTIKNQFKEVIELSSTELDGVMMSHKEFLEKQAKSNGTFPTKGSVLKTGLKAHLQEPQYESLDFESWHYMSEDENSNLNKTQNEPTLYRTALDISLESDTNDSIKTKRLPEVAGITLKAGEMGGLTNSVFISTNDLADSSFSSSSSSPQSK